MGSQVGLLRWDGYKLRTFLADATRQGALPDSYVLALHVDAKGRMWIGTSAGGVARYDDLTERFETPVAPATFSRKSVFSIAEQRDGTLLLGTGGGLDRLDPVRNLVQRHVDWAGKAGLPPESVSAVLLDRHDVLWVGTERGLYRRAGDATFVNVPLGTFEQGKSAVYRLIEDTEGRVWVGTKAHGVFTLEAGSQRAVALGARIPDAPSDLGTAAVHTLLEARPGEVWIGTAGVGIFRVHTSGWRLQRARHIDNVAASLPRDEIAALFLDKSGLVWVATDVGVGFHYARDTAVTTWFAGDRGRKEGNGGLIGPELPCLLPMADGSVWVATGEGGIDVVTPTGGRVRGLRPHSVAPLDGLPDGGVLSLAAEPGGQVVYAGTRRGLYRIDVASLRTELLEIPDRPSTAAVRALAWDRDRLWVGGLDGLWAIKPGAGRRVRVEVREDGNKLGDSRISALLPDQDGSLWVGTRAGLVRFDPANERARKLPQEAPGRLGLPGGFIVTVLKDPRGRVWVAGYGSGVAVFEPTRDGVQGLRRVSTREGLQTNAVNAVVVDRKGDVWVSTDEGLARIDGETLKVDVVGPAQGLGLRVFWATSSGITPDGHVLFGANGGLTIIDPRRNLGTSARSAPKLVITEVRLGDAPPITSYRPEAEAPPLVLNSARRSLLLEFAALHYAEPASLRYQYRLRGTDTDWIDTDASRRFAAYTNLSPGAQWLELRASTPDGPWSTPVEVPLLVRPLWHETTWARGAAVLIAIGGGLLLMRARTLVLRRRAQILEGLVAERTLQLEQSQRQLEQIAYFDGLTGLANRRMFNDELKRMVATSRRSSRASALLLVDLDYFKQINDRYGHDAGDAMLTVVAERLTATVRETERVARLGGDEFAILLFDVDGLHAVTRVCERIFTALGSPIVHGQQPLQPSASVGAALCPGDAETPEALYKAADVALYEAKRAGRNTWRCCSGPHDEAL